MTQQARTEITKAETRIAKGIARLYQYYAPSDDAYDAQGIATVQISADELKDDITACFPNKLAQGITLHFFRHDFIQHPPIRYMITEKLRSLYLAAKTALPEAIDEEILASVNKIILEARQESNTLGDDNILLDQQAIRDQLIHKKADLLMQEFIGKALHTLHQSHSKKDSALSYEQFAKQLITHTQQHIDHTTDTLTFNKETCRFSYEEASNNTDKKRDFDGSCTNLGLVCEGFYSKKDAKITTSFVRHATPAPIEKITHFHLFDRNQSDLRVLLKTCELMEEVIKSMAHIRRHGKGYDAKPISIDWNYQLLTQSGLNIEKQATTYGYIINAALLTSGAELTVGDDKVITNIHVMNSEVTRYGHWGIYKKDTQRRENRKTYLHLTKAIDEINFPDGEQQDNLCKIYEYARLLKEKLSPTSADEKELYVDYQKRQLELKSNAKNFYNFRKLHSYKKISTDTELLQRARELINKAKEINDGIRKVTYKIEKIHLNNWKKNREEIANLRNKIQEIINGMRAVNIGEQPLQDLLALFYKSYMDELYYSNNYRGHTAGPLFNGYCTHYQHLTGNMASVGCKTGSNRTYAARLVIAALKERSILPSDSVHFPHFPIRNHLNNHAMSNAALFSRINYTAGGTPDVDFGRIPILEKVENLHFFRTFWRYCAHNLHKIIAKIKKFFSANTQNNNSKAMAQSPRGGSSALVITTLPLSNVSSSQSLATTSTEHCSDNSISPSSSIGSNLSQHDSACSPAQADFDISRPPSRPTSP